MKLLIAGSRSFNNYPFLCERVDFFVGDKEISSVICGMARGPDLLGKRYAEERGILVEEFPADWSLGLQAGYLRNVEMGNVASHAVIFWDGKSKGSKHMIDIVKRLNKPCRVVMV